MFDARQLAAIKEIAREINRQNKSVVMTSEHRKVQGTWKPLDQAHAAYLRGYRPSYWTEVGLVEATLHKIDVSQRNGETIAYYDVTYKKPYGATLTKRYIWAIRNGSPKEIHQFDYRVVR